MPHETSGPVNFGSVNVPNITSLLPRVLERVGMGYVTTVNGGRLRHTQCL